MTDKLEMPIEQFAEAVAKENARLNNRIEKLEAALDDVAGYLARADWYYLKPETRETLEPQSYRGQQDDSALKADHPTALSAEDIRKMNHE